MHEPGRDRDLPSECCAGTEGRALPVIDVRSVANVLCGDGDVLLDRHLDLRDGGLLNHRRGGIVDLRADVGDGKAAERSKVRERALGEVVPIPLKSFDCFASAVQVASPQLAVVLTCTFAETLLVGLSGTVERNLTTLPSEVTVKAPSPATEPDSDSDVGDAKGRREVR